MKLTLALLIATFLQLKAEVYSQQINISQQNAKLEDVFKQIMTQTSYEFIYASKVIQVAKPVDIELVNASLQEALDKCFAGQPLTYVINQEANTVIVKLALKPTTGKVTTPDGGPLPGATIIIKGTTKGTTADANGNYSIDAKESDILVFSFIGFKTQEIAVNGQVVINVVMESEVSLLNELVVVGYGTTARKDLTGSVSTVKTDDLKRLSPTTIDGAMAGKAAGVQILKADGSPGGGVKMRIRGGTSLVGGNDPLYIIDGVQVTPQNKYIENKAETVNPVTSQGTVSGAFARGLNNLGGLNINDIESLDVLKDASATAIYGSKAANGVVIITTRKGKLNQKPILEANYYTGISTAITEKRLDAEQYKMILKEGAQTLNDLRAEQGKPSDPQADLILNDPTYFGSANTDWIDLVTRPGISHNADISVRGGGTGSRYYTSLSYSQQQGVLEGTDFTRLSGKISLDNEISDRLRIITNLDYGYTKNNVTNGIYSSAQYAPPTFEAYNEDGSINLFDGSALGIYTDIQNPLALLKGINEAKSAFALGALSLEYDILKTLKFRSTASVNYNGYHQLNYLPSIAKVATTGGSENSQGGVGSQGQTEQADMFFENTLTWDKQFNENNRINLLAGTSWQQSSTSTFSASGQTYPDDEFLNGLSSAAIALPPTASEQQNALLSFYVRANYALKERYLFTFTGRSDESSKFPKNNRVGYFPSFGVAWRITQENFMKGIKWIDELKLRASAGRTGTQNIGNNMFYTLYSPASYGGTNALIPTQLGNDKITWESTLQKDLGLDFAMFKSRLRGTIGYYEKYTTGLLLATNVARSSGFNSVYQNLADIRNRGWEVDLSGEIINNKDFQWTASMNVSSNQSKVMKISRDLSDPNSVAPSDDPFVNSMFLGNTIIREGEPIGLIYGYQTTGLIKTQEEADAYKQESLYAMYGLIKYVGIGDSKYQVVDTGKYKGYFQNSVIGHAEPKFYGGFTNTFTYKSFTLTALLTYSYGGDLLYLSDMDNLGLSSQSNKGVSILDRYTVTNTNTDRPRLILKESGMFATYPTSLGVYDASYLKLKSITLNWQLPSDWTKKLKITHASLYGSVSNLFTITHYPGPDPEISDDPYSMIGGYSDSGSYPTIKQYSVGVRMEF